VEDHGGEELPDHPFPTVGLICRPSVC